MKEIKDAMIANLRGTNENGNLSLTDIATPYDGFSSNFDIIRNYFPNGLPDASRTNLDLNLTTHIETKPNEGKKGKVLEAKAKDDLEAEARETFKSSGLLNDPSKKDDWFYAIDDMARDFHDKFQKLPNCTQAWSILCLNPPESYGITKRVGHDDCIFMNGSPLLSKKAFNKRWKKYTSK